MPDDNLNGLDYQLQNPIVKKIADFVSVNHSTYVRQFLTLKDEIEFGVKEARSNIKFLKILVEPSKELDKCTDPSCIESHLMNIVHLFRTVWLNSPYYNSNERIENLFKALSHQIIILCRSYIDFKEMFAGNAVASMKKFEECINACANYKSLYEKVTIIYERITLLRFLWEFVLRHRVRLFPPISHTSSRTPLSALRDYFKQRAPSYFRYLGKSR